MEVTMYFIESRSPWQNGRCESFNSRPRDELLNGELFSSIAETRSLHDRYRTEYNQCRPHSSLGYLSPLEFVNLVPCDHRRVLAKSAKRRGWCTTEFFGTRTTGEGGSTFGNLSATLGRLVQQSETPWFDWNDSAVRIRGQLLHSKSI